MPTHHGRWPWRQFRVYLCQPSPNLSSIFLVIRFSLLRARRFACLLVALKKLWTLGRSSLYAVGCLGEGILLVDRFIGLVSYPADECNVVSRSVFFLRALLREFVSALWRRTKNWGALSRSRYVQIGWWFFMLFRSARLMLAWIECSHLISQSRFKFVVP